MHTIPSLQTRGKYPTYIVEYNPIITELEYQHKKFRFTRYTYSQK